MLVSDSINPVTLIAYAGVQVQARQWDNAYSLADRVCIQTHKLYAPALALRGRIHHMRGDIPAAAADFVRALTLAPRQFEYLKNLALLSDHPDGRKALWDALGLQFRLWPQLASDPRFFPIIAAAGAHTLGAVWYSGDRQLSGWAVSSGRGPLIIELDQQRFEAVCSLATPQLQHFGIGQGQDGFTIRLPDSWGICRVGIGTVSLWGSPILPINPAREPGFKPRTTTTLSSLGVSSPVDIIIPVHSGLTETLACLDAVRQAHYDCPYQVLVVNDASPDPGLCQALRQRAARGDFQLIERAFNAGFIGAVNTALAACKHDVVLLNADTLVANDWLDRLQAATYSAHDIGTATPLTNHGELVSHPRPMRANLTPNAAATAALDQLLAEQNGPLTQEIPTGVGFCLYIRRAVLDQLGGLDERSAFRGYGEETDFCLRATQQGWRHVCATRVFVTHRGSISFGSEKAMLAKHNTAQIRARYPEHGENYQRFLDTAPLKPLQRNLQRRWLATLQPGVGQTCTLHDLESYAQKRNLTPEREISVRLLYVPQTPTRPIRLVITGIPGLDTVDYDHDQFDSELLDDLRQAGIRHLSIGSTALWPLSVIRTLTSQFTYDIQLEDYSAWCPRRYLLQSRALPCIDPLDVSACEQCLSNHPPLAPGYQNLLSWRTEQEALLASAQRIIVPSAEMAKRYQRRFGTIRLSPRPIPRLPMPRHHQPRCVVVPALLHAHQGFKRFIETARHAYQTAQPTRFLVLGEVQEPRQLNHLPNVNLLGPIAPHDVLSLLKAHRCEAISDFSPWPVDPFAWAELARASRLPIVPASLWIS